MIIALVAIIAALVAALEYVAREWRHQISQSDEYALLAQQVIDAHRMEVAALLAELEHEMRRADDLATELGALIRERVE